MVLLVRIELTTSPLPRECSTTELQQPGRGGPALVAIGPPEAQDFGPGAGAFGGARGGVAGRPAFGTVPAMIDDPTPPPDTKADAKAARARRLAEALRRNLRRRKATPEPPAAVGAEAARSAATPEPAED